MAAGRPDMFGSYYHHTFGHISSDLPRMMPKLAKGDFGGILGDMGKFAGYHSPDKLLMDFSGGSKAAAVKSGGSYDGVNGKVETKQTSTTNSDNDPYKSV